MIQALPKPSFNGMDHERHHIRFIVGGGRSIHAGGVYRMIPCREADKLSGRIELWHINFTRYPFASIRFKVA